MWDDKILTALYADPKVLEQDDPNTNIVAMNLEYRLKEIQSVLNSDLIPHLFKLNGWEDETFPTFEFDGFNNVDLDGFSSAIQRMGAVGMIEVDRPVLNRIREVIGVEPYPSTDPVHKDILSGQEVQSKSGKSLNTPSGGMNGTSNSVSSRDNSVSNKEN
jgi:hypothetical protein